MTHYEKLEAREYLRWASTLESCAENTRRITALAYLRGGAYPNDQKTQPGKPKPITDPLRLAYTQAEGELVLAVRETNRALSFVHGPDAIGFQTPHESIASTRATRLDFEALHKQVEREAKNLRTI